MNQRIRAGQSTVTPKRNSAPLWLGLLILLLGAGGWFYWDKTKELQPQPPIATSATNQQSAGTATLVPPDTAETNPSEQAEATTALPDLAELNEQATTEPEFEAPEPIVLPALAQADPVVNQALTQWLGKEKTYAFIQSNGFVRRFVATVDNLPRQQAPATVWPLNPTAPRFQVEENAFGQDTQIAAANAARYKAAVAFAQSLDMTQAAAQYKQYYPLFQQAYEELGYPGKQFNTRLIAVIDHLLQAPEPTSVKVNLVEIKGEHTSEQPWTRYEFADPKLQELSSGQKVLVRIGPENALAIKAQLRAFRQHISG